MLLLKFLGVSLADQMAFIRQACDRVLGMNVSLGAANE
jgi:hypothetical protein